MPDRLSAMLPPPKCISILLCERMYRLANTPDHTIIVNAFHSLRVPAAPCSTGPLTVLFSLTDGHGEYALTLTLTHAETGAEVGRFPCPARLPDPLAVTDVELIIKRVRLPALGKYLCDLTCDGHPIASRPFRVMTLKPPKR